MDPNPIKHPAVLLAHVREVIEPILHAAGYHFQNRNDPRGCGPQHLWIDYSRGPELVSLRWDAWQAKLSLEAIDANGILQEIALVGFAGARAKNEIMDRANGFIQIVRLAPYFTHVSPAASNTTIDRGHG